MESRTIEIKERSVRLKKAHSSLGMPTRCLNNKSPFFNRTWMQPKSQSLVISTNSMLADEACWMCSMPKTGSVLGSKKLHRHWIRSNVSGMPRIEPRWACWLRIKGWTYPEEWQRREQVMRYFKLALLESGSILLMGCAETPDTTMTRHQIDDLADDDRDGVINQRDLCADTREVWRWLLKAVTQLENCRRCWSLKRGIWFR